MGISKEEAIKELQTREEIFVAYSQATKLPYVKCDEETFNDQAKLRLIFQMLQNRQI